MRSAEYRRFLISMQILIVIGVTCSLTQAETLTDILGAPKTGIASQWTSWSSCDRICQQGYKFRSQDCIIFNTAASSTGTCNWNATEVMSCYNCSGNWESWNSWSKCNTAGHCGFGNQTRDRSYMVPGFGIALPGNGTGSNLENRTCEVPCDRLDPWGTFNVCSNDCGVGTRSRKRTCYVGFTNGERTNASCSLTYPLVETEACSSYNACAVIEWQPWNPCSNSCGNGTRTRKLICEFGKKYKPGECDYNATEVETCIGHDCPTLNWTAWSDWSECNTTCNLGIQTRYRNCTFGFTVVNKETCGNDSTETRICNENNFCPVPTWSNFTEWSACSVSCGNGIRYRNRTCLNAGYGLCFGNATEQSECNVFECPVPILGEWMAWFGCEESCDGVLRRERNCTVDGNLVNLTMCHKIGFEEKNCSLTDMCKMPFWSSWGDWSSCSEYCGNGLTTSRRRCIGNVRPNISLVCSGDSEKYMDCTVGKSCTQTFYTMWTSWSSCSVPQYESIGSKTRSRECITYKYYTTEDGSCAMNEGEAYSCPINVICPGIPYPSPYKEVCNKSCHDQSSFSLSKCRGSFIRGKEGDVNCPKKITENDLCTVPPVSCDVKNCSFTWNHWGECSAQCGQGTRTRVGDCLSQPKCNDTGVERQTCYATSCPIDGNWESWSAWSSCSRSCGGGERWSKRSCSNPEPSNGGRDCFGDSSQTELCNLDICPVNGGFSEWSSWSRCNRPCNNGTRTRTRECNSPTPAYQGAPCTGETTQTKLCNSHRCKPASVQLVLRFVDEKFNGQLENEDSAEFMAFKAKLKQNVQNLYGTRNSPFLGIKIWELKNGSIISNFTVYLKSAGSSEVVVLQSAIEDRQKITNMSLIRLSFSSDDLPPPPLKFNVTAIGPDRIFVNWEPVPREFKNYTLLGYIAFYKQTIDKAAVWSGTAVDYGVNNVTITGLKPYTTYTFRVLTFHYYGNGMASPYTDERTLEGVPSSAPLPLFCNAESSSKVLLKWVRISNQDWHGFMRGYAIFLRLYGSTEAWKRVDFSSSDSQGYLTGLKAFVRYEFQVAAYTNAGIGPLAWKSCITLEGAPSKGPSQVTAQLDRSPVDIFVSWSKISNADANGNLTGYRVYYGIAREGKVQNQYPTLSHRDVNDDATSLELKSFSINSEVVIYVSGRTSAGEGPKSQPVYQETCRCPLNIYTSWYSYQPYIYGTGNDLDGIFYNFLRKMVNAICGKCAGSGIGVDLQTTLYFDRTKDGRKALRSDAKSLLQKMDDTSHFHLPVFGRKEVDTILRDYKFIPLVLNSGSAFIVRDPSLESKAKVIVEAVTSCWPALLVSMLMAALAGIVVWSMEFIGNNEFPSSFLRGATTGLWWAFVSMTTMGYGDITPRSVKAKAVSIVWMLIGPLLNAIIIGVISTSLTSVSVEEKPKIYGSSVAVIYKSYEYNMAIRKNGKPNATGELYQTVEQCIDAVHKKKAFGALINSLAAISRSDELYNKGLKIAKVYTGSAGYGMALAGDIVGLEDDIRTYVNAHQNEITAAVEKYEASVKIKPIKKNEEINIFDHTSVEFRMFILCAMLALALLSILGSFWDYIVRPNLAKRQNTVNVLQRSIYKEESLTKLVHRFHASFLEMIRKLDVRRNSELVRYFSRQGYVAGYHAYWKYGYMADDKVKREIFVSEIMLKNLKH